MCFMLLVLTKIAHFSLVYTDLLSEIVTCENLWVIKQCCNDLIVDVELVLFPIMAFNHFEESTFIENIFAWNGLHSLYEV